MKRLTCLHRWFARGSAGHGGQLPARAKCAGTGLQQVVRVCPKTGRLVAVRPVARRGGLAAPLVGLAALIWFLVRVIPKPSRATYPCQRVTAPLAAGFVVWLLGAAGSAAAFRHLKEARRNARHGVALLCVLACAAAAGFALIAGSDLAAGWGTAPGAGETPAYLPNAPVGVAVGKYPGRVAWIHDTNAVHWDGYASAEHWYASNHTDQAAVEAMLSQAVRTLGGATNDAVAWDAVFKSFNRARGKGETGYQAGEKVAIKLNLTTCAGGLYATHEKRTNVLNTIDAAPQLVLSLLRQLVYVAGVAQTNITIGDTTAFIPTIYWDVWHPEFPDVNYLERDGGSGRIRAEFSTVKACWSTTNAAGKVQDYLPVSFANADYFINLAILKSHERGGFTACAKNNYGSLIRTPSGALRGVYTNYFNLHDSLADLSNGTGHYRALVDLMGHRELGGKTLLCLVDGLFAGQGWAAYPLPWKLPPFGDGSSSSNWPCSLFASQDPVAIDSVAFDFVRAEWPSLVSGWSGSAEDYLHEAAQADSPPSGTFYDPEGDGTRLASLGAHEHWNDATNKMYSRNLGAGSGIELVYVHGSGQAFADTHYANASGTNAIPPYASWDTAATNIQDAVDAASDGDTVLVAAGTYDRGGSVVYSGMMNRVAIRKRITVRSVSGPGITTIQGAGPAGSSAVRCAYVTNGAVLAGFTLQNGATRSSGDLAREQSGGGAWCERLAVISNCVIRGNTAKNYGGGMYYGQAWNCLVCSNSAGIGGGVYAGTNWNCTIAANTATNKGGGTYSGSNQNCVVWSNAAPTNENYAGGSFLFSCTGPTKPSGTGNTNANPQFVSGSFRLGALSPCINAGTNQPWMTGATDLEGSARIQWGRVDMGCYEYMPVPALAASPAAISNLTLQGSTAPPQVLKVWNSGTGTVSYAASADVPWLTVIPGSGSSTGEQDTITVSYNSAALATGTYAGAISISSSEASNSPLSVPVTLHVRLPEVRHVAAGSTNPVAPFTSWATAAARIQDAVDVALEGDTVLVSNGVYSTGGRAAYGAMTNRVMIGKAVTVKSVNGPAVTGIAGQGPSGNGAVRCAFVTNGAVLAGFTLSGGSTRTTGDTYKEQSGGGIWCAGGVVSNCVITGNVANLYGGGAYGATLWNSLVAANRASNGGGTYNGTNYSCTVASNTATNKGGGIYSGSNQNCVVWGNTALTNENYYGGTFLYSCTGPAKPSGTGNTNANPQFAAGSFRLSALSPCINAGTNQPWMTGAFDLDGGARIQWGRVDMGCYEYVPMPMLGVSPQAVSNVVLQGATASPQALKVWNGGTGTVSYAVSASVPWLAVNPASGSSTGEQDTITVSYNSAVLATGTYSGAITISAAGAANSPLAVPVTLVVRLPEVRYVAVGSAAPVPPYTSWATAAARIQDAVDVALEGDTVLVSNGVYSTGGRAAYGAMTNRVMIAKAITVKSVNGAGVTTIAGQGPNGNSAVRCAFVTNGAVLAGFTLSGGATRVTGETYKEQSGGGAFCMPGALISGCVLAGNTAYRNGGAVTYGVLRNSLVTGNSAASGGGTYASTNLNCTVAGNSASASGGGTYSGSNQNSVVWGNTAPTNANYVGGIFTYSCAGPTKPTGTGNTNASPLFADEAAGNYRLLAGSPCIDRGTNLAWMAGATDLDGNVRIQNGRVDIGAYEAALAMPEGSMGMDGISGGPVAAPMPRVWSSGDSEGCGAWNLVDGDTNTLWVGKPGGSPWRVTLDMGETGDVCTLDVLFFGEPWTNMGAVGSADTVTWFDLATLTNGPRKARYLYMSFWENGAGTNLPAIRELLWGEGR